MKHKVFFGVKLYLRVIFSTIILLSGLIVVTIIRDNQTRKFIFELAFYGLIILNILLFIGLYALYKTRIVVGENDLYGPFHIWYPNFKFESDNAPFFKTIPFKEIESFELEEVYSEPNKKTIQALKVSLKDKYALCILLDGFDANKVLEIQEMIQHNLSNS